MVYRPVVVRYHPDHPFNPQVIIAFGHEGNYLHPKELEQPFFLAQGEDIKVIAFGKKTLPFMKSHGPKSPFAST